MRALIVIPTYNEIENLQPLVESIFSQVTAETEVLVVDDNSPDGTGQLADFLATQNSRVHVLHREEKKGLGAAYVAGFKWGLQKKFSCLIEMDADFSHHPRYLPKMLELLTQYECVIGSRYIKGGGTVNWGWFRKFVSRGGSFYARSILGVGIRDLTGGFNGWRASALESLDIQSLRSDGYSFQIELKHRAVLKDLSVVEFPIVFEDRKVGHSKMNRKIIFEALGRVWQFRVRSSEFKTCSKENSISVPR